MIIMNYIFTEVAEKILNYLKDKGWVEISQIRQYINLPEEKLIPLLEFLAYSNFINFDNGRKKIRIGANGKTLQEIP